MPKEPYTPVPMNDEQLSNLRHQIALGEWDDDLLAGGIIQDLIATIDVERNVSRAYRRVASGNVAHAMQSDETLKRVVEVAERLERRSETIQHNLKNLENKESRTHLEGTGRSRGYRQAAHLIRIALSDDLTDDD